jgi:hypothetical protein
MSTAPRKYQVRFTTCSYIRIDLVAASEQAAIAAAEQLWCDGDSDDPRFIFFGGDAFEDVNVEPIDVTT